MRCATSRKGYPMFKKKIRHALDEDGRRMDMPEEKTSASDFIDQVIQVAIVMMGDAIVEATSIKNPEIAIVVTDSDNPNEDRPFLVTGACNSTEHEVHERLHEMFQTAVRALELERKANAS